MKKKKINLDSLKVDSFVTSINKSTDLKGGGGPASAWGPCITCYKCPILLPTRNCESPE